MIATNLAGMSLKELNSEKRRIGATINRLENDMKEIKKRLHEANEKRTAINAAIKEQTAEPVVTEHAIVQYFARVLNFDLDEIRAKILPDKIREQLAITGSGRFPIGKNAYVVVEERQARTVITKGD